MNLRLLYLGRNLGRNKLRTLLTTVAVALPMMIFVISMGVVDGVQKFLDNSAQQLRLAITQKTSIIIPLPEGHRAKMETLDPTHKRLTAVCGIRWLGGKRENDPTPLSTIAVDPDTFPACFPENKLTPEELEAWQRDRTAIFVGRSTAADLGWKVGQRVTILTSIPPYLLMEFHVISTLPDAKDNITIWCRRDYFEEELKKGRESKEHNVPAGLISFYFVKCGSKSDLDEFRVRIDQMFEGSQDETKSQDEKSFMNEFITQQFDLPRNLTILSILTTFVAVMAAMNTMSMNFRDRIGEIATLKSLGFGGGFVFMLIQTESLLLCTIGGLVGSLGPYIAFNHTALKNVTLPLIQSLEIMPITCVKAVAIALGIAVIAAAWPSWVAMRMNAIRALRNTE